MLPAAGASALREFDNIGGMGFPGIIPKNREFGSNYNLSKQAAGIHHLILLVALPKIRPASCPRQPACTASFRDTATGVFFFCLPGGGISSGPARGWCPSIAPNRSYPNPFIHPGQFYRAARITDV